MDAFAKLRDALKAANPTITVSVRRCRVPRSLCGDCRRMSDHFLVRVDSQASSQEQLDTLVHEFAHAIAWTEWESTGNHGKVWASAYADCYRIYEKVACP
jgi:hypothetical protein